MTDQCHGVTDDGSRCKRDAGWGCDSDRFCVDHLDADQTVDTTDFSEYAA